MSCNQRIILSETPQNKSPKVTYSGKIFSKLVLVPFGSHAKGFFVKSDGGVLPVKRWL